MNTKDLGNKAESVILSQLILLDIPALLPFGDNLPYDIVIDTSIGFKSIQVKHGLIKNGCVISDTRKRIGSSRVKYETYYGKVDFIAIWCSEIGNSYILPINMCDKTYVTLRIEPPKNNSCISSIIWAKDYEFNKIKNLLK